MKKKKEEKEFIIKKRLGQNFLKNDGICKKIAIAADVKGAAVMEIGPGFGALTKELLKQADFVFAIEKDEQLILPLKQKFGLNSRIKIINADFLEVDLKKLVEENRLKEKLHICANLPYYITTPIIIKILSNKQFFKTATIMVQKEVAKRLTTKPGEKGCSSISVFVHYFSEPKILMNVSRGSFFPVLKLKSSVIKLTMKDEKIYNVEDEEFFFKMVRLAFSQRRKMLIGFMVKGFKIEKEKMSVILKRNGLKENVRVQEISLLKLAAISNEIHRIIKQKEYG